MNVEEKRGVEKDTTMVSFPRPSDDEITAALASGDTDAARRLAEAHELDREREQRFKDASRMASLLTPGEERERLRRIREEWRPGSHHASLIRRRAAARVARLTAAQKSPPSPTAEEITP